jgi:hypothetical protein
MLSRKTALRNWVKALTSTRRSPQVFSSMFGRLKTLSA